MTDRQIAAAIRERFPKHSNAAYSLASHSEETGVQLVPEAQEIADALKHAKKRPRKDYHKKQYSFKVRVTEERHNEVKRLIEEDGQFPTINAWLDWWIYVWVKNKKAAIAAGTADDGKPKNTEVILDQKGEKVNG